jgi:hypothetical protein
MLDVALAAGGCEAAVEGFYSLVNAHKKAGRQGNEMLVKRAVVDWSLLDFTLTCPKTMEEIGQLYTKESKKLGLAKHRMPLFSDERSSKAIQRQSSGRQVEDGTAKMPPHYQSGMVIVCGDQFNRTMDQHKCRANELKSTK